MDLAAQLRTAILAQSLPPPSAAFIASLISSRTPPAPLASLLATAKARLLACDLADGSSNTYDTILDGSLVGALPPTVHDATAKDGRLRRDVHVQVVDVENLALSRWEQVEELEAIERGERTRGREVIRVAAEDEDGDGRLATESQQAATQRVGSHNANGSSQGSAGRSATHRLVLQDRTGKRVYAVEMRRMDRIGVGKTSIGEKVLLRTGTAVARGTVLLEPDTCVLLGGKIEAWHEAWVEGRMARLKEAVGGDRPS